MAYITQSFCVARHDDTVTTDCKPYGLTRGHVRDAVVARDHYWREAVADRRNSKEDIINYNYNLAKARIGRPSNRIYLCGMVVWTKF